MSWSADLSTRSQWRCSLLDHQIMFCRLGGRTRSSLLSEAGCMDNPQLPQTGRSPYRWSAECDIDEGAGTRISRRWIFAVILIAIAMLCAMYAMYVGLVVL